MRTLPIPIDQYYSSKKLDVEECMKIVEKDLYSSSDEEESSSDESMVESTSK